MWPDFWKQQVKSLLPGWSRVTSPSGLRQTSPPAVLTLPLGGLSPLSSLVPHLKCPSPPGPLCPQRFLPVPGALVPLCRFSFPLHLIHLIQPRPPPATSLHRPRDQGQALERGARRLHEGRQASGPHPQPTPSGAASGSSWSLLAPPPPALHFAVLRCLFPLPRSPAAAAAKL